MFTSRLFPWVQQFIKKTLHFGSKQLSYAKNKYQIKTAQIHPNPILILGHQKSGTTVIATLLSEVSGQALTSDVFYQVDPQAIIQEQLFNQDTHLADFINQYKFYFSTPLIKAPNLTFFYKDLISCFPNSIVVFVARDPRNVIRSILNRLTIPGNLTELDSSSRTILSQMPSRSWQIMLEQGKHPNIAGNNYIEKLAYRWNLAMDIYLENSENIILIRYEDFKENKIKLIHNLADEVSLKVNYDITNLVNIQYQPGSNHQVSWIEFFGENNLSRIETICQDRMQKIGYGI